MNTKPIDKTKKTNIKCEHCEYWRKACYGYDVDYFCKNVNSPHHGNQRNYWNRCKQFVWEKEQE